MNEQKNESKQISDPTSPDQAVSLDQSTSSTEEATYTVEEVTSFDGLDIIGQSQSGTGKTGAFSIGTLQRIDPNDQFTQALVLAPTRELADQIHKVITNLATNITGLEIELAIGGVRSKNFSRWEKSHAVSHIVIGTPGRVLDNLKRKRLDVSKLRTIVLDEADEMLSRGFVDQVYEIFQFLTKDTQVALFSATMPQEVLDITHKFMTNPLTILVKQHDLTLEGIKQFYVALERRSHKMECLFDLFEMISITQAIIYVNTKRMAEELHFSLQREGFSVGIITGNMAQDERNAVMTEFRSGKTRVLISTDMLARGIDVQQVSLVLNYDLPREKETYIHRIGRSGRFGRKGVAINLITSDEYENLKHLEQFYNTQVEEMPSDVSKFL
jgi:translation initiation factor 4A